MKNAVTASHERGMLDDIDARTRLAGSNCMEILLFSLGTQETFGINVFKVREVCKTPKITRTPNMPQGVEGLISLRGNVIPVVSLVSSMGLANAPSGLGGAMMVAEYNKRILGFLVHDVDRITRVAWDRVRATAEAVGGGQNHQFITAVTELSGGRMVSILDVEQIMASTFGEAHVPEVARLEGDDDYNIFFVDDSLVARKKIVEVLDKLGCKHKHAVNGMEAWSRLQSMANHAGQTGVRLSDEIQLILTDAEMPEMDGYMLTRNIKSDSRFDGIPVVMHSSLSSEANRAMGKQVGVDAYVAKFDGMVLAETLRPLLTTVHRN
ncbi:MAG: chemotaxis protein [Sterolibacterium sp.]|nr:chemotaxis protein [Sterolibacterium sp.]